MAALIFATVISVAIIMPAYAQFNMWPLVDSSQLASAMGFSVDCLNVMYLVPILRYTSSANNASFRNTTVTCDPDLFRMAGQVDLYYWVQDNITALCTPSCIQSSSDWLEDVYSVCDGQSITVDSKMIPVESVAIRYADGIGLACLTDMYELFLYVSSLTDPSQVNYLPCHPIIKLRKPIQITLHRPRHRVKYP